jgi:hypothetical protein
VRALAPMVKGILRPGDTVIVSQFGQHTYKVIPLCANFSVYVAAVSQEITYTLTFLRKI